VRAVGRPTPRGSQRGRYGWPRPVDDTMTVVPTTAAGAAPTVTIPPRDGA